jgi:MFS family permease
VTRDSAPASAEASVSTDAVVELPRSALIGLLLSTALVPMGSTMIAVALPAIGRHVAVEAATLTQWLVNSYLVVGIVLQSPAGKLGDRWGARRALMLGHVLFAAGSAVGFVARSFEPLVVARVAMAAGGALVVPATMALLRNSTMPARRARVFGLFGASMGLSAAVGPAIGGLLVEAFGWRAIFLANLPLLALASPLVRGASGPRPGAPSARFDWIGSLLLGAALGCAVVGSKTSGSRGPLMLGSAGVLFVAFVLWERRVDEPVLDPKLFRRSAFVAGAALIALHNLAMYSLLFQLPLWFSFAKSGSSGEMGRALLVMMLSMVVCSPIGGRASERLGARSLAALGTLTGLGGILLLADLAKMAEPADALPGLFLVGAGLGLSAAPAQATALGAVAREQAGMASGALSTARYLGAVVGIGVLGVALGDLSHAAQPTEVLAAHRTALFWFALAMAIALVPALLLPGRPSPRRGPQVSVGS